MTSTTLKCKNNFTPAFSKIFKRRIVDMAVMLAVSVIIPVSAIIIAFTNYIAVNRFGEFNMNTEAIAITYIIAVINGFFALFTAPKLFSEIYKKQSCDLYFSMPIKREERFSAAYIYGFIVITASFLISSLLYNLAIPMLSNKNTEFFVEWDVYLKSAMPVFLAVIALYSIFILCAVTAGRKIQYFLLCFISVICTSTFTGGFTAIINSIWGMAIKPTILSAVNPIENIICNISENLENTILLAVISVIEATVSFVIALIVFRHRKAEVAEMTLAGKIIPYVFLAILTGAAFMYGYFNNSGLLTIILGTVLAALITMAFTGIFYKKAFTKQTGITAVCVCVICSLFVGAVCFPSHSSFVKKLPEAENVESVEIYDLTYNGDYSGFISAINNNIMLNYNLGSTLKITDEQSIKNAIALHQKMIDDKTIEEAEQSTNVSILNYLFGIYEDDFGASYDCKFVYKLKSGRKMTRTYSVPTKYVISEFAALVKKDEILSQICPFNIKKEDILFADYERYDYNAEGDYIDYAEASVNKTISADECRSLIDAYKNDMLQLPDIRFINNLNYPFYLNYIDEKATTQTENNITVYYFRDDVPEEIKQKISAMSPSEIKNLCNYYYDDTNELSELQEYNAVVFEVITIYYYHTQTNEYLNSVI